MDIFKKYTTLEKLVNEKIVAVIRGDSESEVISVVEACKEGGIKTMEVTYTIKVASKIISHFSEDSDIIVGAGTVLDSETAKTAISAGAKFIVGPNFSKEVAILCNRYQIPYIPGCQTVNEVIQALEAGCDLIKLFPGNNFDFSYIKSLKAPIPKVNFMVTGGVNTENINEWLKAGALAVGIGGNLVKGTKEDIVKTAEEYLLKIKEV
ncbi:bifunctional 4-hydroxy-2-oxoglutarate aldolase/2-dehydro-3-deoxy-phosphogluconate aldolase [Leptotrichia sp. OH3620_COT-345]|uniref:bifunctional 2-keto-4-hydroxyglutarate aldolase/2-keto-3-deoxy-6-phosphogluconate aldolase n=1 Tax=Leptotrichia sp. OH3620_COT-345 TaxID=2491048 RepID=UPI000F6465DB|nr:bifunctional 2-keto-4-hydroxyglutarate aldolase/2-keto-3-deoxy-6-phosphogluconate aldolase [Leptotrichia sp. OH3620_COT-345]RRD40170.1 bifunctional 4-hydroxy-2-oxoglutarate aldolase/2-dehydro-3-deoxy-phosphogluconate aldolase [Leptotrichia sp. OH3620_COT-345]